MPDLPADLRSITRQAAQGDVTVLGQHAYPGAAPSVWEVSDASQQRYFIKRLGIQGFRREVHAYRNWTSRLEGRSPRLLASDENLRAVVVSAVPGRPADHQLLDSRDEAAIYRQAGELLARLHSAASRQPTQAITSTSWTARSEKALHEAVQFVPAAQLHVLRRALSASPPALPRVAAHGDYQPKNWMWDADQRLLYVIDFERAALEPAVQHDLVRMEYRILTARPDLRSAFYTGYGRWLTAEEQLACRPFAALDAVSALAWGHTHNHPETIGYGTRMLDTLSG